LSRARADRARFVDHDVSGAGQGPLRPPGYRHRRPQAAVCFAAAQLGPWPALMFALAWLLLPDLPEYRLIANTQPHNDTRLRKLRRVAITHSPWAFGRVTEGVHTCSSARVLPLRLAIRRGQSVG